MRDAGFSNEIVCVTNPSPADDFGHTIPYIMEEMTPAESAILQGGDYNTIKNMISKKRIFGRESEKLTIRNGMAFTIEPRPRPLHDPTVPMVYFHTICTISENGEKELLTNFDELFQISDMIDMCELTA